jgi:hypothetical protein
MSRAKNRAQSVIVGLALAVAGDGRAGLAPSDLLAPGPRELDQALGELEARLDRADAAATALIRTHNALGEALASAPGRLACDAPAIAYVARTEPLGTGYRDRVQAARAQGERLATIVTAPTVLSLADGPVKARTNAATTRLSAHERSYAELDAWQKRFVVPLLRRCHPALAPGAGIGEPSTGWVAVVALGPGRVCPSGEAASEFTLVNGPVCVSLTSCSCTPAPVAPGAVVSASPASEAATGETER